MPQHTPNSGESKSDFMARCMGGGGTHDECVLRFNRARGLSILAFANDPELSFVPHVDNPMFFDKDVLKVGTYMHPDDGWTVDVDVAMIDDLVNTFNVRKADGNSTEIVVDHKLGADDVVGYLEGMRREGDRLIATHGMTCQRGVDLANTVKNVSVMIDHDCKDGKGNEYGEAITHSAICQRPVVPGQDSFVKLSLNNQEEKIPVLFFSGPITEEPTMDKKFFTSVKTILGTEDDVNDKNLLSLIEAHSKKLSSANDEAKTKITALEAQVKTLSAKPTDKIIIDPDDLDDKAETAEERFDNLVAAGNLTADSARDIKAALIGPKGSRNAFALSTRISGGTETVVKQVIHALSHNNAVKLGEQTGMQVLKKESAVKESSFNQETLDTMLSMANNNGGGGDSTLEQLIKMANAND